MKGFWGYLNSSNFALTWGISTVIYLLLGLLGGNWADRRLGTSPLFLLVGLFLGVGMSFKSLMTELGLLSRRELKRDQRNSGRAAGDGPTDVRSNQARDREKRNNPDE